MLSYNYRSLMKLKNEKHSHVFVLSLDFQQNLMFHYKPFSFTFQRKS